MRILKYSTRNFERKLGDFIRSRNRSEAVTEVVSGILEAVQRDGDEAVLAFTEKFDRLKLTAAELRVPEADLKRAAKGLSRRHRDAFREAIKIVSAFHREGLPRSWQGRNAHGALVGEQWYPIHRVGIYIPAGSVPLVSTIVMTTTLAKIAGVKEIAVFTSPGPSGEISPQMLAGMHLCGIKEVYRIGGAQAIAAAAFGTQTIRAVDKVMGPGNAFVTEAQRQVFGTVGVDLLPGPSEALAIADDTARADWLAADLLAQAEHGSGREKIYYVYSDPKQRDAVKAEIKKQLPQLKHEKAIRHVLKENTLFIEVANLDEAIEVANFVAPEHLELHVGKAHFKRMKRQITTSGAMLFGHETPTVLGDFTAGPSHTLPTGRTGRFFSGLKITDFMRRSSLVQYDRKSLVKAREVVQVFSELEDLDAHGNSMEIRFEDVGELQ